MARKLYLDDAVVAALQDALTPLKGQDATLDQGIDAVLALRRNRPKNWGYQIVDETGKVWDHSALCSDPRTKDNHHLRYARNQGERKRQTNDLAALLGLDVVIERREYDRYGGGPIGPWARWYTGRPA